MSGASGEYLDLTRASHQSLRWAGNISTTAMPRLAAAVADPGSQVSVGLQTAHDGGRVTVQGRIQADLKLTCQRCFGNLEFPVTTGFNLAWVRSEQEAMHLPEPYEPLLSASGRLKVAELVEDELLLALPMVALHAIDECRASVAAKSRRRRKVAADTVSRPFASLKALKRR
jgi:uncharacterized protein